jgi:hypothetical protein
VYVGRADDGSRAWAPLDPPDAPHPVSARATAIAHAAAASRRTAERVERAAGGRTVGGVRMARPYTYASCEGAVEADGTIASRRPRPWIAPWRGEVRERLIANVDQKLEAEDTADAIAYVGGAGESNVHVRSAPERGQLGPPAASLPGEREALTRSGEPPLVPGIDGVVRHPDGRLRDTVRCSRGCSTLGPDPRRGQLCAAANTRHATTIRAAIGHTNQVVRTWRIRSLVQAMSNRSVCTRSAGTPSSTRAASAASIIGSGPQMKYWTRL